MENTSVFKRYETKYILNESQRKAVMDEVLRRMTPDKHGESTVRNIYFDTKDSRLIRNSLDKPIYKEKFRIRSYQTADSDTTVFAEIKKKYKSVVYKRRIALKWNEAERFISDGILSEDSQIAGEINYLFKLYGSLSPAMYISYDRQAFFEGEFKATFDENILYRSCDMSLAIPPKGERVLAEGLTLMELKSPEAIPLWMTKILSENKIYKTSFSKYGEAYKKVIKENNYEQSV